MWHHLAKSRSSTMRLFCAMAMSSSGAYGFLNRHETLPDQSSLRLLLAHRDNFVTKCSEASKPNEVKSYQKMEIPQRGAAENGHAIFGLLLGDRMIENYEIYKRPQHDDDSKDVIIAYAKLGDRIDGHPNVVHGGILSLLFDDALGFGYEALNIPMAVTANLNVDFRSPVPAGTLVRVAAQLQNWEGRKVYWKAQMTSMDQRTLFAEATSLYIIPRSVAEKIKLPS